MTSLISDYDLLEDDDLRLVQGAIRLSAHVLAKDEDQDQLQSQLLGRLMAKRSPGIRAMWDQADLDGPWLRPLTPSLISPGGPLRRIIVGHAGSVLAVAVTQDSRWAVSGSYDHTLKVWDLETGKVIAAFTADGSITTLAVAPNGRGQFVRPGPYPEARKFRLIFKIQLNPAYATLHKSQLKR